MIRTLMPDSFAEWFNRVLAETPDPVTGKPYTNDQIGEVLGFSAEKVSTWRRGTRVPSTVEDVAELARFLRRSQSDILEAIGYEVVDVGLSEDERRLLAAFRRLRSVPILQQAALGSVEGMPAALGPHTPSRSRGRQRSA